MGSLADRIGTSHNHTMGRELCIVDDDSGLAFFWNRSHTVNIYQGASCVDVMSIGDFSQDTATLEDFERAVESYLSDSDA